MANTMIKYSLMLLLGVMAIVVGSKTSRNLTAHCGSKYTKPKQLIWLPNRTVDCEDSKPCSYTIAGSKGTIIQLNFTSIFGQQSTDFTLNESGYHRIIDGESSCQPRIMVSETYEEERDVQVTRHKTLCYDKMVPRSSVVMRTQSQTAQLSVYCLPAKYSFFSVKFAFVPQPEACNSSLKCHGKCIEASRVCDGVNDCNKGEDETDCDVLYYEPVAQGMLTSAYGRESSGLLLLTILSILGVLLVLLVLLVFCICQRKVHLSRYAPAAPYNPVDHRVESTSTHSEQLLQITPECGAASPNQRPTRRHGRTAGTERHTTHTERHTTHTECHRTHTRSPTTNHQAPFFDSPGVPSVIRSRDGEHGHHYSQYELKRARDYEQKYNMSFGEGPPPNVTLTADGSLPYQTAMNIPRNSSNTRSNSAYAGGYPPPYSQHNPELATYSPETRINGRDCLLPHQHSNTCLRNADRRGSCPSYTSHGTEPPTYEMAVCNDTAQHSVTNSDSERTRLSTYHQSSPR